MNPDELPVHDDRVPCPDDLCTGVLDADGRCGTCGRQGDGSTVAREHGAESPRDPGTDDDAVDRVAETSNAVESASDGEATDSSDRVPCVDDLCTGILGPDGRCGTCGREARSDAD